MPLTLGITGGAGFVGTNLAAAAVERGHRVVLVDVGDRLQRVAHAGPDRSGECHFVDLAQPGARMPDDLDLIIHLAALPHVDYSLRYPEQVMANNLAVHTTVLGTARERGIPVLFTSSIEVYGGNEGPRFSEDDRLRPLSPYAASKVGCEYLADSYRAAYSCAITTLRLTNLYGPWQAPDRVIPRLIGQAFIGQESEAVLGRLRDFLYIDDAIGAILAVVEAGCWGGTYNLCAGEGVTLDHIAGLITSICGRGQFRSLEFPDFDGRGVSLVASPRRLVEAIDWKPATALAEGIERTVSWYRDHRSWWSPFEPALRADRQGPDFLLDHVYRIGN